MTTGITTILEKLNKIRNRTLISLAAGSLVLLIAGQLTYAGPGTAAPEGTLSPPPAATSALVPATLPDSAEQFIFPLPFDPPVNRIKDHPLEGVIAAMRAGKSTETRDWVLPLLVKALAEPMREARITGYSSRDADGGGCYTRWGTRVRWGICAADPRYWGPGSVIWMGDPVNQVLVVEDTGSAIRGHDRFDVCTGDNPASSARIGTRHANYVPLYISSPTSRWGDKPEDWSPPLPPECSLAPKALPAPRQASVLSGETAALPTVQHNG